MSEPVEGVSVIVPPPPEPPKDPGPAVTVPVAVPLPVAVTVVPDETKPPAVEPIVPPAPTAP